jgi:hypothetical protein
MLKRTTIPPYGTVNQGTHLMNFLKQYILVSIVMIIVTHVYSEPIVINGAMIPGLVGKPIHRLRVLNSAGKIIPFQIDEITVDGEYVCPSGGESNSNLSNGVFDPMDELVVLGEDCTNTEQKQLVAGDPVIIRGNGLDGKIFVVDDSTIALSDKKYIEYSHDTRLLKTPWFYAQFGKDRFHFEHAGITSSNANTYVNLTEELRVEIMMKALFGLFSIYYTENNLICFVKRWKVGPIRLIRRGDFHLNLGLGIKGSRAAVNQICYPQMVIVPVMLHVPVRFGSLFKDASVEMAPVLTSNATNFHYTVPDYNLKWKLDSNSPGADTIIQLNPCNTLMSVNDGKTGYGWILQTTIPDASLKGSGILFRKPSHRKGIADCGYHLEVNEVEKGYYNITNWVLFADDDGHQFHIDSRFIMTPAKITTNHGSFDNPVCTLRMKNRKGK